MITYVYKYDYWVCTHTIIKDTALKKHSNSAKNKEMKKYGKVNSIQCRVNEHYMIIYRDISPVLV